MAWQLAAVSAVDEVDDGDGICLIAGASMTKSGRRQVKSCVSFTLKLNLFHVELPFRKNVAIGTKSRKIVMILWENTSSYYPKALDFIGSEKLQLQGRRKVWKHRGV